MESTRQQENEIRSFESSVIGNGGQTRKGTLKLIEKIERSGDQVRHTPEQSTFAEAVVDGSDEKDPVVEPIGPSLFPAISLRFSTSSSSSILSSRVRSGSENGASM